MIQFDEPKLATGGSGGLKLPPVSLPFARPEHGATPQQPHKAAAPRPSPALTTALAAAAMASRAIKIHKLDRRVARGRIAADVAKFKSDLAEWRATQPDYDESLQLQRDHESKIRRAFRSAHSPAA